MSRPDTESGPALLAHYVNLNHCASAYGCAAPRQQVRNHLCIHLAISDSIMGVVEMPI